MHVWCHAGNPLPCCVAVTPSSLAKAPLGQRCAVQGWSLEGRSSTRPEDSIRRRIGVPPRQRQLYAHVSTRAERWPVATSHPGPGAQGREQGRQAPRHMCCSSSSSKLRTAGKAEPLVDRRGQRWRLVAPWQYTNDPATDKAEQSGHVSDYTK